jgi:hypothetical protein
MANLDENEIAVLKETENKLKESIPDVKSIIISLGCFFKSSEMVFLTVDFLKKEDYPNNIPENSKYLKFIVDYKNKKIELCAIGHVYLSPADKASKKYMCCVMKSMQNVFVDMEGKKFRKQSFKTVDDLVSRISKYSNGVIEAVKKYTGGYPYERGILK